MTDELLEKLLNETETNYCDFKKEWYKDNADLIKDILCMANSLTDSSERYLIIGISEDSKTKIKTIEGIKDNKNRKNAEQLLDTCRSYINVPPDIEVITKKYKQYDLDIIKIIPNNYYLPYVSYKEIKENKEGKTNKKTIVYKNNIYSRQGGVNTRSNENAPPQIIEELFNRKYGRNLLPIERFNKYILDYENWDRIYSTSTYNSSVSYVYKIDPSFRIVLVPIHFSFPKMKDFKSYNHFLTYVGLKEDFWKYISDDKNAISNSFSIFNAELQYNGYPIKVFYNLIEIRTPFYDGELPNDLFYTGLIQSSVLVRSMYKNLSDNDFIKIYIESTDSDICHLFFNNSMTNKVSKIKYEDSLKYLNLDYLKGKLGF